MSAEETVEIHTTLAKILQKLEDMASDYDVRMQEPLSPMAPERLEGVKKTEIQEEELVEGST